MDLDGGVRQLHRPLDGVTEQEVQDFALANGPPHQHPRNVEFVVELPLAGTNKIDRRALLERAAAYAEGEGSL